MSHADLIELSRIICAAWLGGTIGWQCHDLWRWRRYSHHKGKLSEGDQKAVDHHLSMINGIFRKS